MATQTRSRRYTKSMIKPSNVMQRSIEMLAKQHGIDLTRSEAHFRLEMPSMDPLVVENIGPCSISVCHYYERNGDSIQDPEIEFYVNPDDGQWYPYAITMLLGGYRRLINFDANGRPETFHSARQHDAANFGNTWGRNVRDQGWSERATCTRKHAGEPLTP